MKNADTVSTETASQAPEDVLAWLVARLEEVSRQQHRLAREREVLTTAVLRVRLGVPVAVVLAEIRAAPLAEDRWGASPGSGSCRAPRTRDGC